nr:uncharacterized protein LOC124815795 [Hydra vulgaris]
MMSISDDVYSIKMTKMKLKEVYGESLRFVKREGRSNIILLDSVRDILCEKWYQEKSTNVNEERERVVITAAKLLKNAIKNHDHNSNVYPSKEDILNIEGTHIPQLLKAFVNELVQAPLKQVSISQVLFSGTRPRSIMPLQFGLSVAVDNRLSSKWLNILLSKLGFGISYDEVIRYKQNVVKHDTIDEIISGEGTSFLQFVADNTDYDIATVDGKNTHHGLGSIAIANGKFTDVSFKRNKIPRDKKELWSNNKSNDGIMIRQYYIPDIPSLTKTIFKPVIQEKIQARFIDLLWNIGYLFKNPCPSGPGYMSSATNNIVKHKSNIAILPVIDLHATNLTALYSLLCFIIDHSKKVNITMPSIKFDQQLYIKAYEIVTTKNLNIFVRLGGFHQLEFSRFN